MKDTLREVSEETYLLEFNGNGNEDEIHSRLGMLKSSIPIASGNLFTVFLNLFSMHFAGAKSTSSLAAFSLALTWFNLVWFALLVGSCNAFAAMAAHAFGAKEMKILGYLYQKAIGLNLLITALATLIFYSLTCYFISGLGQEELGDEIWEFTKWMPLSCLLSTYYETTRYYLMSNHNFTLFPKIALSLIPFNYLLNWVFLRMEMGMNGIALAKIMTELSLVALLWRILKNEIRFAESYFPWRKEAFSDVPHYLINVYPSIALVYMDYAAIQLMTVIASQISQIDISVMTAIFRVNSILFNIGFGFSMVVKNLLGNALGAGKVRLAKEILYEGVLTFCYIYAGFELITYFLFPFITAFFSSSVEFEETFNSCRILFHLFLFIDPAQTFLNCIYRALSLQKFGSRWYVATYFCLGIPLAVILGLFAKRNVKGLLEGLSFGCCLYLGIGFIKLRQIDFSERAEAIHNEINHL